MFASESRKQKQIEEVRQTLSLLVVQEVQRIAKNNRIRTKKTKEKTIEEIINGVDISKIRKQLGLQNKYWFTSPQFIFSTLLAIVLFIAGLTLALNKNDVKSAILEGEEYENTNEELERILALTYEAEKPKLEKIFPYGYIMYGVRSDTLIPYIPPNTDLINKFKSTVEFDLDKKEAHVNLILEDVRSSSNAGKGVVSYSETLFTKHVDLERPGELEFIAKLPSHNKRDTQYEYGRCYFLTLITPAEHKPVFAIGLANCQRKKRSRN